MYDYEKRIVTYKGYNISINNQINDQINNQINMIDNNDFSNKQTIKRCIVFLPTLQRKN